MHNAVAVIEEILAHGQQSANDSPRRVELTKLGQHTAQGDISLFWLPSLPKDVKPANPVLQLAPGISRGSRHCIAQEDAHLVQFYELPNSNPLQGNVLKFNGDVRIEHPEHGDQILAPGIYLVTYQRRFADEVKRIQD